MSLFRKPKKNLRNRIEIDNDEDDPNNDDIDEIHQNINKLKEKKKDKKKNRDEKPKEKKNTLLSFDDEEGEDVTEFKVKKSKESRRLIKMREKEKKDESNHKNGKSHSNDDVQLVENKNGKDKIHIIDDDIGIVMKVKYLSFVFVLLSSGNQINLHCRTMWTENLKIPGLSVAKKQKHFIWKKKIFLMKKMKVMRMRIH